MPIHLIAEVATIGGAAYLMVRSGLQSRLLERHGSGMCPSCGRRLVRGACESCSRRD
jgi:hypothetical protein